MKKMFLTILLALCSCSIYAQKDVAFWFAAPQMSEHTKEASFHLMLFAYDTDANVRISQPANPDFTTITAYVYANSYQDITLAQTYAKAQSLLEIPVNQVSQRGLYIEADAPVGCYYQITAHNGEAFTLKGNNALGTDFCVAMQNKYANGVGDAVYANAYSSVQIVATEDNTQITITPSQPLLTGSASSTTPVTITLNKGETYAFRASGKTADGHIVSTLIRSDKPIAVTSTDDSVAIGTQDKDAIGEQILPIEFAGTEYAVISQGLSWEGCFCQALYDNTKVKISNGQSFTLKAGDNQFVPLNNLDAAYITSTQPIQVFQITGSGTEVGGTVLPQITCTGSRSVTYKRIPGSAKCVINLLTKTTNTNSLYLNGNEIDPDEFHLLEGTDGVWSYAKIDVSAKPANMPLQVVCKKGVFQMGVIDYSSTTGQSCTYGFFSDYAQATYMDIEANGLELDTTFALCGYTDLYLVAHPLETLNDIIWTLPDGSQEHGDTLWIRGATAEHSGLYLIDGDNGMCEVEQRKIELKILTPPAKPTIEYVTIEPGEEYIWQVNGQTYTEDINDTVYIPLTAEGVSQMDCDSVVILQLRVNDCLSLTLGDIPPVCGDEDVLEIPYNLERGSIRSASVIYDDLALQHDFLNGEITFTDEALYLPLPDNVYANTYTATLRLMGKEGCDEQVLPVRFLVQYPSTVFAQKWDDVLALYNATYNRGYGNEGYTYTACQWYKDGEPIIGATTTVYYVPEGLDFSAEYAVLLTRPDGTTILSCAMQPTPDNTPDILPVELKNTQIAPAAPLRIIAHMQGHAQFYTTLGLPVYSMPIQTGDRHYYLPLEQGVYMLRIEMEDGYQTNYRIVTK